MSEKPSRYETASPKRTHLMNTAWRLFYRDGFRVVGIDTILAEAGVAKMTLYNHFASKEELVIAVLESRDAEFRASLAARVEEAGRSASKRFQAVFDWLKDWFASEDFKGCVFIRALSEYPEPSHPIHKAAWRHKTAVLDLLKGLGAELGVRDPAGFASSVSLLIDGAIVASHATESVEPLEVARSAAEVLLKRARPAKGT